MDSAPPDPVASDRSGGSASVPFAPGSGPNVDVMHVEYPATASVVDALVRSPQLEQEFCQSSTYRRKLFSLPRRNQQRRWNLATASSRSQWRTCPSFLQLYPHRLAPLIPLYGSPLDQSGGRIAQVHQGYRSFLHPRQRPVAVEGFPVAVEKVSPSYSTWSCSGSTTQRASAATLLSSSARQSTTRSRELFTQSPPLVSIRRSPSSKHGDIWP
ncbi:hypothetical protein V3C99_012143 [Haemonchus contortus]